MGLPALLRATALLLLCPVFAWAQQHDWLEELVSGVPQTSKVGTSPSGGPLELHCYLQSREGAAHVGLKLCWLRLGSSNLNLDVREMLRADPANDVYRDAAKPGDVIVTTGSFFARMLNGHFGPVGIVISSGRKRRPLSHTKSGAMIHQQTEGGQIEIVPIGEVTNVDGRSAIQSTPLLMRNGQIVVKSSSSSCMNRLAIGVSRNGDLVIAGAFADDIQAISLADFARFLSLLNRNAGTDIRNAVNQDGGPGAHLFFPQAGIQLGYPGTNFVPNVLAIRGDK